MAVQEIVSDALYQLRAGANNAIKTLHNPIRHPIRFISEILQWQFLFVFGVFQWFADKLFSPTPPGPSTRLRRPKVAIIGAGITGVTSAAHCIGHGFDVVIFEAGDKNSLGGIWSKVNNTSSLQIHSFMYRFHPSVKWQHGYPDRQQIISQVKQLWKRYGLDTKTKFNTNVEKVYQDEKGRWVVNSPSNGRFEGVIAAVGTCGDPKMPRMDGMQDFKGDIYHSSKLTGVDAKDKTMIIIGGGASAVEALEYASEEGASKIYILSRSDKWIIPRNWMVDILLSLNIWGQETLLSAIPEALLKKFFYRDLQDIAPDDKGIFMDTPMVNSDVMDKLRSGKAEWIRCDIENFTEMGVYVNMRDKGVPKGGPGRKTEIQGDVVVMATGYKRPSLNFLPDECFAGSYGPPNWYLQTFPPEHPSISAINCTYLSAIGTVGNWHIGIYTRILLMFLVDPLTRPSTFWMERWIDMTKILKATSPTGAFDFFTYLELLWWFFFCVTINPFRWKWATFVFFGLGFALPKRVESLIQKFFPHRGRSHLSSAISEDVPEVREMDEEAFWMDFAEWCHKPPEVAKLGAGSPSDSTPDLSFNEDFLLADLERQVREKLHKIMGERKTSWDESDSLRQSLKTRARPDNCDDPGRSPIRIVS
ncbi:FAD/NAD(P)-binding domain-containing protein [Annulohypoxylon truncatum]|uniref:FAD/NAD(P)-binding domain-containing protein n=1 Tax=Annulohypoxylon truncatum TaxID=327061 RepID=UPI00200885C7|nr:FAD/NAD(P)-binding domain-containing protein [Annulohypoxylon truncatum]KAI1208348.1 FAD/NAD(P)-binding domain-containing protein [Annulohypoxylon truncatum]